MDSSLVRLDIIKSEFIGHLPLVYTDENGVGYTSTEKVLLLSRKGLFKQIKDEARHNALMRLQGGCSNTDDDDGYDKPTLVPRRLQGERYED